MYHCNQNFRPRNRQLIPIGGLKPGETKVIRGKIYVMKADLKALKARYEKDFPKRNQP